MPTPLRVEKMEDGELKTALLQLSDQHGFYFYFREKSNKEKKWNNTKLFFTKLGGMNEVSKCLDVRRESIWRWCDEDLIPMKYISKLQDLATTKNIPFPVEHINRKWIARLAQRRDKLTKKIVELGGQSE